MAWDDEILKTVIERAAEAVGKSRTAALQESGVGRGWLNNPAKEGRRIDMLVKLMGPLEWHPADLFDMISECFGWPYRVPRSAELIPDRSEKAEAVKVRAENVRIKVPMQTRIEIVISAAPNRGADANEPE